MHFACPYHVPCVNTRFSDLFASKSFLFTRSSHILIFLEPCLFFVEKQQLPLVKTLSAQTSSMPHTADLRKAILVPRAPGASWKNSLMVAARDHNGREPYMFLNKGDIVLCACEPQPVTGQACRAVLAHRVTVHDDGSYTVHNAQHLVLTSTFTPDTPSASSSSCAP